MDDINPAALFKDLVRTAQQTLFISVIKTNQFMLYGAECETNTKRMNTVWTERIILKC